MKRYSIQEVKDKELWVKCSGDGASKLLTAMGCNIDRLYLYINNYDYYKYCKLASPNWVASIASYIEPAIDFSQIDFDLEIEGYLAPYDMFDGNVNKDDLYIKSILVGFYKPKNNNVYQLPAEIVKRWQPKYKEERIYIGVREVLFDGDKAIICDAETDLNFWVNLLNLINVGSVRLFGEMIDTDLIDKIIERLKK